MPTLTTKFYETRTDTELCEIALHGHIEEAFGVIYDRYRDRIYRLACSYAEDRDDAEDVTQQVFIRAHRSLHQFRGGSQLFTWLYRIAINCCKDW
ncbi:RNA polymerase subunit sigma-70, partial [bacterium]|nr:RNA polymerase subunit sigma-70 [bacterium]